MAQIESLHGFVTIASHDRLQGRVVCEERMTRGCERRKLLEHALGMPALGNVYLDAMLLRESMSKIALSSESILSFVRTQQRGSLRDASAHAASETQDSYVTTNHESAETERNYNGRSNPCLYLEQVQN
jgi:hypothetical protein